MTYRDEIPAEEILQEVSGILTAKRYDPANQLTGYLLTEDPTYLPYDARSIIRRCERDELIETVLNAYVRKHAESGCGKAGGDLQRALDEAKRSGNRAPLITLASYLAYENASFLEPSVRSAFEKIDREAAIGELLKSYFGK